MKNNSVVNLRENKIGIIGDNILYNGPIITAYYWLPLANYSVTSSTGKLASIESITDLLTNLAVNRPGATFSIQRCSKVIKAQDVYNNLLDTIHIYRPDYDMPEEFTSHIVDSYQDYCLLGVDIQQSDILNSDAVSTKDTLKEVFSSITNKIFDIGNDGLDIERIMAIENNIFSFIKDKCARCTRELTFYQYVSKLYPSYEISYEQNSYFNDDNFSDILGVVNQTVEDNFGYFIMHNEGIDFFDLPAQNTYGCILNLRGFPMAITSENFPLSSAGMQINIQTLPKDKAEIQLKRRRSTARYKVDEATQAGEEGEVIEEVEKVVQLSTNALENLKQGVCMCRFNVNMLVIGLDLDDLTQNVNSTMATLRDRGILVARSLNQAQDFINNFVRLAPSKFDQFSALQFPLSFQSNFGSVVGQFDAETKINNKKVKLNAPIIGEAV